MDNWHEPAVQGPANVWPFKATQKNTGETHFPSYYRMVKATYIFRSDRYANCPDKDVPHIPEQK